MAVRWSPEWLSETAVANLLSANTGIENIFISDTLEKRVWPCLIVKCVSSEEMKIGVRAPAVGGYLSGVFQQKVEVALEIKADLLIKPSQNAQVTPQAAKLWQTVYQAFHQDTLLQTLLTNSVSQPYECFSAYLISGEETIDAEMRLWRKTLTLELKAMANSG